MALRLFRTFVFAMLAIALLGPSPSQAKDKELRPAIAFASTRDDPSTTEIYLIDPDVNPFINPDNPDDSIPCTDTPLEPDHCDPRRLTDNAFGEVFAAISPDGKKIVFDSNRRRTSDEPVFTSDLFLMNTDGTDQTFLARGSSASWSPDSKYIAYHASASGTGKLLAENNPGSATEDSDIFLMNVDDCLERGEFCRKNLTNTVDPMPTPAVGSKIVEDDVDWSPDGSKIIFIRTDRSLGFPYLGRTAEIYEMNPDGTGQKNLTNNGTINGLHERAPEWSPDGKHIVYMCGRGGVLQICVMNADGSEERQLTPSGGATPTWSPDGEKIVFHHGSPNPNLELWWIDNMHECLHDVTLCHQPEQLTDTPGINLAAIWGVVRITGQGQDQVAADSQDRAADKPRGPAVAAGPGHDGTADQGKQDKDNKAKNKHNKHNKQDKKHKNHQGSGGKSHR